MLLHADEDFPLPVVKELRLLAHDVLTAQEDGQAGAADVQILARAHALSRAVLTHNRRHYERLDWQGHDHSGIIAVKQDPDHAAVAVRIDLAIKSQTSGRWRLRVNRPNKP